jgi:predicted RNA-binding protein Jag
MTNAIRETEDAIRRIRSGARSVDLAPQVAYIRRKQHDLARAARLVSHSYGNEPHRRVRIFRDEPARP